MAEAVALAASVLALAQIGWDVAKGLFDLAGEVGTAGEAVCIFANDFWLFIETVKILGNLLDCLPPVSRRAQSTTEELLEVALEQVVQPFQQLLRGLEPLLVQWRNSPSRMRQLGVRLQWAFSCKKKVLFYHAALNALKGNVSLLLQTMSLRGQNPPHIHFILRNSVEDTRAGLQGCSPIPASRLLRAANQETRDGRKIIMRKPVQTSTSAFVVAAMPAQSSTSSPDQRPPSTEMALVSITDVDNPDEENEVADSLIGITLLERDPIDKSREDQEEHEEQLEAFGAIRAMQKKVIKLADEATTASASTPNKTDGSDASPFQRTSEDDDGLPKQPPERAAASQQKKPKHRPLQQQKDQDAPKHQRKLGVAATDPEAARKAREVIHFVDSLGSTFEIPYEHVRVGHAMTAFIGAEYREVEDFQLSLPVQSPVKGNPEPGFAPLRSKKTISAPDYNTGSTKYRLLSAIQTMQFTYLYSEDGMSYNMVLLEDWDNMVKPGGRVRILLDNEDLRTYTLKEEFRTPTLRRIRMAQMTAVATMKSHLPKQKKGNNSNQY